MDKVSSMNNLKILLVDDDAISMKIYQKILGGMFSLLCAGSGAEAIRFLEREDHISLAIVDIYMPHMSGFRVLEYIKSEERLNKIPVLMCTASESEENVVRALEMGASDCITKPIQPQIIRKRVQNVIQREYLERLSLENSLMDASSKLHLLMDTVPGGILELGLQDEVKIFCFNDTVCDMTRLEHDEFAGRYKDNFCEIIYESDRAVVERAIKDSMEQSQKIDQVFRICRESDFPLWVHLLADGSTEDKKQRLYHAILFDISREKEAEMDAEEEAQKFRYLAEHDSLTGINNRKAFCDKTQAMLLEHPDLEYVLLGWDVEHFKVINDVFGDEMGNRVLKTLAMHFATSMLGVGSYGRLGDDHFAICYPVDFCEPQQAYENAKKALSMINIHYDIGICMGVYPITDRTMPVNNMCDRAMLAIQETKGNYLKNYAYYDSTLIGRLRKEQELCNDMESAIKRNEFKVYIQPKYDLVHQHIVGGEALVRWKHPQKGMVSPGEFIPLFEKNGAIVHLDSFVWEKTCSYLHDWAAEQIKMVPLSVNISRKDFVNMDVASYISNLVQVYQLDPKILELEVTESVYANDKNIFYKRLEHLQELGFRILMDDFGSGYSSFNMLKDAPVDGLKLDLKFLSGSDDRHRADKIMAAIMYMAKLIDMPITAEGVETAQQVQLLKEMHCEMVQGFYFARPVPADTFKKMLREQQENIEENKKQYEESQYQRYVERKKRNYEKQGLVLIAEDAQISQEVLCSMLEDKCDIITARDGEEAMAYITERGNDLDLVILDNYMPKIQGMTILKKMNESKELGSIPAIMISSDNNLDSIVEAYSLGAVDYFVKPFIPEIITARVLLTIRNSVKLRQMNFEKMDYQYRAAVDPMTNLYNKVILEEMVDGILGQYSLDLHAMMIFDMDNFKSVNDLQGHLEGDTLIKKVSSLLSSQFRKTDLLGRIGGDEFVAFMPNIKSREDGRKKAAQIVELFAHSIEEESPVHVTISIGLVFSEGEHHTYRDLFSQADRALYRAKSMGKCRYEEYTEA